MNLYWVQTDDHDEDWFIVANDDLEASCFHEDAEGYNRGDAWAELVVQIPRTIESTVGWPSDELLLACGAKILRAETPRVVEIKHQRYCEGMLEHEIMQLSDDVFEAYGEERLNRTDRRVVH